MAKRIIDSFINELHRERAIIFERRLERPGEKPAFFDVRLGDVIYKDWSIRHKLARLFLDELNKRYSNKKTGVRIPFGIIGVSWTLAPVVGIISHLSKCPIVAIDPARRTYPLVFGSPLLGYTYAVIDDVIRSGNTISSALKFWTDSGYKVDFILTFCDMQFGGNERIQEEISFINQEFNLPRPELKNLTSREQIKELLI